MKKYFYLISFFCLGASGVQAQQLVFDPAVVSTLVVNHTAQQSMLSDIKDNEGQILGVQRTITHKLAQIRILEERMYNSLKSVQAIVGQSKNIVYVSTIAKDIGTYQGQMMDIVVFPRCPKQESHLLKRWLFISSNRYNSL